MQFRAYTSQKPIIGIIKREVYSNSFQCMRSPETFYEAFLIVGRNEIRNKSYHTLFCWFKKSINRGKHPACNRMCYTV